MKDGRHRAGHQHVAVLAPFDLQFAAVHHDGGAAAGQPAPVRVHQRRAGAGAAGAASGRRRAPTRAAGCGPAPGPGRSRYWRARGTADRAPGAGPSSATGRRATSATKNVACGLPMLAAAGSATGPAARSRCSVSIGRASGMSGQSSRAGPISTRTRPSGSASDGQVAGDGADDLDAAAGLARQQIDDAAGGVAAGAGLGAVGVADAHEGIGVGVCRRRLDGDELVAADAGAPVGDRGRAAGVRPSGPARSSNTTKSLPQPCILRKRAMGRVYAAAGQGWKSRTLRHSVPYSVCMNRRGASRPQRTYSKPTLVVGRRSEMLGCDRVARQQRSGRLRNSATEISPKGRRLPVSSRMIERPKASVQCRQPRPASRRC